MRLVLFDIDGTLINPGGAGARAANKAFEELFLIKEAFSGVRMAGKTDPGIMKEGLVIHGLESGDGALNRIFPLYLEHLQKEIQKKGGSVLPGVKELLDNLAASDKCLTGLLTGNIEKGARIKLEAFGLSGYFQSGAFGNESEDRNELLPVALQKIRKTAGPDLTYRDCVVIGDTPMDVACAKPYGALSIAVATGPYSGRTLMRSGADHVLEDLRSAPEIFGNLGLCGTSVP